MRTLRDQVDDIIKEHHSWGGIENNSPKQLREYLESIGYEVIVVGGDMRLIEWECTHAKLPRCFVDIWVDDFTIILGVH